MPSPSIESRLKALHHNFLDPFSPFCMSKRYMHSVVIYGNI